MNPILPDYNTLRLVMPEIWLAIAMCAVILVPFIRRNRTELPAGAALVGLIVALVASLMTLGNQEGFGAVFSGMLVVDQFSQFFKVLLLAFTTLVVVQWLLTSRTRAPGDAPDFLCLLLGGTLGMALMASANNLVMIFIATETASLASYPLAGFRKRNTIGSEGSLKYVLTGAVATAIMVYGMSLLYGVAGTLDLSALARVAAEGVSPLMAIGLLGLFAGLAFKLSAVPLHFWCPDVFQGAPTSVTTFLSVASKGAALALLLRVLGAFGLVGGTSTPFIGITVGVVVLGAVTATWGNLVAMHQINIKRLLAYSSIAHAGYMIMAAGLLGAAGIIAPEDPAGFTRLVAAAVLFHLLVYVFMNLGAFTVAALIVQGSGKEDITDYAGLIRRSPLLCGLMILFLLSLFGMPGLGGFMGKIFLMQAMAEAGKWGLLIIAVLLLNTLLSLYYYMRPVYYMVFMVDREARPAIAPRWPALALLVICAVALLWTGLLPGTSSALTRHYATLTAPEEAPPATAPTAISALPEAHH